jgi:hypothetical protein
LDKRKPAHLAVAGLWSEAHQDNEHKVKEWCNDDCTKDDLGIFGHWILQKRPGLRRVCGLEAELRLC